MAGEADPPSWRDLAHFLLPGLLTFPHLKTGQKSSTSLY
jgi:hypothetical protein